MDIQSSSTTLSTPTPTGGGAASLESSAKARQQADLVPPVKVDQASAPVDGGKVIDLKV